MRVKFIFPQTAFVVTFTILSMILLNIPLALTIMTFSIGLAKIALVLTVIQITLFIPTLDTTTKFIIIAINFDEIFA